jgi:hypothetical protein
MKAEKLIPDDKDKQIIKLCIKRVSYEKMTRIVFLSVDGIRKRIKVMKDYYQKDSLPELIDHLVYENLLN